MAYVVPIAFGVRAPGGAVGAGLIGLILVAGAYMAETIRAGIQAVPKGQSEAARSLGMSPSWTMISVVLPQAIRLVIPPLTNERSEEHTSELQSLMRISYAVFCLKKKIHTRRTQPLT